MAILGCLALCYHWSASVRAGDSQDMPHINLLWVVRKACVSFRAERLRRLHGEYCQYHYHLEC